MKARFPPLVAVWLALLFASSARAQFYAPDTEYHDRAQRHFVVEFARILAWRENQKDPSHPAVAEVTYEIGISPDRKTTWKVHWLDANGKPVRDFNVSYDEKSLTTGADFYRTVSRSMIGEPKKGTLKEANLVSEFWQGADSAGASRAESLEAAFKIDPGNEANAPKLAGLLAQAALPSLGNGVSLDSVLLARAAAWLCVAEADLTAPPHNDGSLWAPILFLSCREYDAAKAWGKTPPVNNGPAARWWAKMLSRPSALDAFTFAGDPANRKLAVPMLMYEALRLSLNGPLSGAIEALFPDGESLSHWHDYAPHLENYSTIDGGRLLEGAWPALSRRAWVGCMQQFSPSPLDYQGYADALKGAGAAPVPSFDGAGNEDASLAGLDLVAPLINLGFSEGVGKLTPVAVATARDLLNFGWEMSGIQMGARYSFVKSAWGVEDLADSISSGALSQLDGVDAFLVENPYWETDQVYSLHRARLKDYTRLQEIDGSICGWLYNQDAFDHAPGKNVLLWVTRCWLRPSHLRLQSCGLCNADQRPAIPALLQRERAEGGPLVEQAELQFLGYNILHSTDLSIPGIDELRLELINSQPEFSSAQLQASWGKYDDMSPFQAAQELEREFWKRPGSDMPYDLVFNYYLVAHAYDSARRFYSEAIPFLDDVVTLSNGFAPRRLALALYENEDAAIKQVLRDSDSGSYQDMINNAIACAAHGDLAGISGQVNDCIERYPHPGAPDMMVFLKGFIPLIPALANRSDPAHNQALDYFGTESEWPTLQWLLARNAKLSPEEAARFLGGPNTEAQRELIAAWFLKDKELFGQVYDNPTNGFGKTSTSPGGMCTVIIRCLRNDLFAVPVPADQPDLKPAGAQSLSQAVRAAAGQGNPAGVWSSILQLLKNP